MGSSTAVQSATVTVTINPEGQLQLDPNNGDVTMLEGTDTITFNLVNADPDVASARFTNGALGENAPWYLIRWAGPSNAFTLSRADTQLILTDNNQNPSHGQGNDQIYKYGINVAVFDGNGNKTILTFDPTIDNEDDA